MHLQVVCPHCFQPFAIDDCDFSEIVCSHCGEEWACNADAEPDLEQAEEYEFEVAADEAGESINGNSAINDWQRTVSQPRPRRKEASLFSRMVPPILGGLSAVPISIAILWYGFGRDLGNAGPTVAKYVPWIVPEALRGTPHRKTKTFQDVDPNMRVNRDFGVMGSRANDLPDLRSSDPLSKLGGMGMMGMGAPSEEKPEAASSTAADMEPPDIRPLDLSLLDPILNDPSTDADTLQRIDSIAQNILSMRDDWESEPSQSWDLLGWDIYQDTLRLAELWLNQPSIQTTEVLFPESLRTLLQQDWYWESLLQAASRTSIEMDPPELFDTVVWPAQFMIAGEIGPSGQVYMVDPICRFGSQNVQWTISDESIRERMRATGSESNSRSGGRFLLIGKIERADESGYVVAMEGILGD